MTDLLGGMPFEAVRDLGWTLLHFLWQGLLLAALLNAILPLCRGAVARHNWALGTLAMMALAPIVTFLSIHAEGSGAVVQGNTATLAPALISPRWIDGLVVLWLAGVAVLSLRAIGGWYMAEALGRRDTLPVPDDLMQRCHALQRRLAVTGPVRFLLSRRVHVPVVIGWLSPLVLIPVSALAGLAPQQLDALILHELAHIRRLDTVTNILLVAVETILFYHPAVWWVARQIRTEREHACDDFAVSACGDAGVYVQALTALEIGKARTPALAANGGKLKARVARLLDAPPASGRFSLSAMAGLAFLSLAAASIVMAQAQTHAYRSSDRHAVTLRPITETHTLPPYPAESLHLKEQGVVLLSVTIGIDGAVSRAVVVKPSGHRRLDDAAAEFVKDHWRWQPATRNGRPVMANTRVSVLFKLRSHATR